MKVINASKQIYNSQKKYVFLLALFMLGGALHSQVNTQLCGTPGVDGPVNISRAVNTFYPILVGEPTLNAGAQAVRLGAVPSIDAYGNDFGSVPISTGDLVLIIQMQDAEINSTNSTNYGAGTVNSFFDQKGGTGFTNIGNTGVFEYVITFT
jgi:hypothetical protein